MRRNYNKYNTIYFNLEKKYNEQKAPYSAIINSYEKEKQNLLNSSHRYVSLLFFQKYQFIIYTIVFITLQIIFPSLILAILYIVIFTTTFEKIKVAIPSIEKRILSNSDKKWNDLTSSFKYSCDEILKLDKDLENEYDRVCSNLHYRPPDWELRREKVLKRDNYTCTQCGWPRGYKRKARELHVHHIKPLSEGGNNSLDNLTTLCHICHKGIDNMHHSVRNTRRRPRNKN